MYVTNFADRYDNTTDLNFTIKCTNIENDIIIPTLSLTIPCGLSCLMSLTVYTLFKPLIK